MKRAKKIVRRFRGRITNYDLSFKSTEEEQMSAEAFQRRMCELYGVPYTDTLVLQYQGVPITLSRGNLGSTILSLRS